MDLNYSAEELAFRDEVRAWLGANLPAELREKVENYAHLSKDELLRWHRILAKKGWVAQRGRASGAAPAGTWCSATSSRKSWAMRAARR